MAAETLPAVASEADLAALLDIAPRTVRDLAKRGVLVQSGRGRYALHASVAGYVRHIKATVETRDSASNRLRETKNSMAELALAERRREVIAISEAEAILDTVVGKINSEMSGLPRRVAKEPRLIAAIDAEIRASLNRVAESLCDCKDGLEKGRLEKWKSKY